MRKSSKPSSQSARGTKPHRATRLGRKKRDENAHIILRERARRLARPIKKQLEKPSISVVPLRIGEQQLAVETRFVLAVLPAPPIVSIPRAGAQLKGLSLVRGHLFPIFDLAELLGSRSETAYNSPLIAILGVDRPELGISVDDALPSQAIATDHISEPSGAVEQRRFVKGITNDGITILDGQILLTHPALFL